LKRRTATAASRRESDPSITYRRCSHSAARDYQEGRLLLITSFPRYPLQWLYAIAGSSSSHCDRTQQKSAPGVRWRYCPPRGTILSYQVSQFSTSSSTARLLTFSRSQLSYSRL
jgi:hypothetical protein